MGWIDLTRTSPFLLCLRQRIFGLHELLGTSVTPMKRAASEEGLRSMELDTSVNLVTFHRRDILENI